MGDSKNTMKKPIQSIFFGTFFFGVALLLFIGAKSGLSQTNDQITYLPHVQLDPTLTPSLTPTPTLTPTATPTCSYRIIDSADEKIEDAIMAEIQKVRSSEKESELTELDPIIHAARLHSEDMALNNYVGHMDSNKKYGPDRLRNVCYIIEEDQEIVWGGTYEDAETLVASWLENKSWERAILDNDMVDFGVGYIKGVEGSDHPDYLTVSFGRRATSRQRSANQTAITCEIPFENSQGSGKLLIHNQAICETQGLSSE